VQSLLRPELLSLQCPGSGHGLCGHGPALGDDDQQLLQPNGAVCQHGGQSAGRDLYGARMRGSGAGVLRQRSLLRPVQRKSVQLCTNSLEADASRFGYGSG